MRWDRGPLVAILWGLSFLVSACGALPPAAPPRSSTTSTAVLVAPPSPTVTSIPTPTPVPILLAWQVANTNGDGVFIRSAPFADGKPLVAHPEKTILMEVAGPLSVEGVLWRKVRDEAGTVGWVKGQYLIDAPTPAWARPAQPAPLPPSAVAVAAAPAPSTATPQPTATATAATPPRPTAEATVPATPVPAATTPPVQTWNVTQRLGPVASTTGDEPFSVAVTLRRVRWAAADGILPAKPGYVYVIADVTIRNLGPGTYWNVSKLAFAIVDASGLVREPSSLVRYQDCELRPMDLVAGEATSGCVGFEAPLAGELNLVYRPRPRLGTEPDQTSIFNIRAQ